MLTQVLTQLTAVVAALLLLSVAVFVGRRRLRTTLREWRERVRAILPVTAVLAAVLIGSSDLRILSPEIAWILGWNLTGPIYDLEGEFILWLQSFATPAATTFFSVIYIYGYVFLLVFPVIAYFALSDTRPLRELLAAYTLNYALGLACYILFISYGPRNIIPEVTALLYDTYPQYQHLTREVNRNTNVFPSLHASLSGTVALMAYRTRQVYPKWFVVALVLAASVSVSTMYLGIHWAIDVVAGLAMAYATVTLAHAFVGRWSIYQWAAERFPRVRRIGGRTPAGVDPDPDADADPGTNAEQDAE
ncbi:phosphatase PAP2 family protein [Halopiger thermotolerans]